MTEGRVDVCSDKYQSAEELLEKQRERLRALASKILAGESLSEKERADAAAVLNAWADQCMNWQQPKRKRGQEPLADHSAVALRYAWLIHGDGSDQKPLSRNKAYEVIADEFGFESTTSVKKIIAERGDWVEMLVAGYVKPKKKGVQRNQDT